MRAVVLLAVVLSSLALAGTAEAGYAIQPADGSTVTTGSPDYLVYLDGNDSQAVVYVASSTAMTGGGQPLDSLGSCVPSTPFGEPYKYTCRVASYRGMPGGRLRPGTYYWWLSIWRVDPEHASGFRQISGPFRFTVAEPTPPAVALLGPSPGATVSGTPTFRIDLPAAVEATVHLSMTASWDSAGAPTGTAVGRCRVSTSSAGSYSCSDPATAATLTSGSTYHWWVVVATGDGGSWIYGPQSFVYRRPSTGGGGTSGTARTASSAPFLPSVTRWVGTSAKHRVLSAATYSFTKLIGTPRTLAIACWSTTDWPSVSGDGDDPLYSTVGFFDPSLPRWIHLSPSTCRPLQTLISSRPAHPNRFLADGVNTLTHELLHALGVANEARTECLSMQTTAFMALELRAPAPYALRLGRLTLRSYHTLPDRYVDLLRCRESGAWDLWPDEPSPPWHDFP